MYWAKVIYNALCAWLFHWVILRPLLLVQWVSCGLEQMTLNFPFKLTWTLFWLAWFARVWWTAWISALITTPLIYMYIPSYFKLECTTMQWIHHLQVVQSPQAFFMMPGFGPQICHPQAVQQPWTFSNNCNHGDSMSQLSGQCFWCRSSSLMNCLNCDWIQKDPHLNNWKININRTIKVPEHNIINHSAVASCRVSWYID